MRSLLRISAVTFGVAVAGVAQLQLAVTPAAAQDAKTYVMKLSCPTINDPSHEWLKRFAAAVEKDSGGRIKGEVYPASQLGSIPRQIEGVQFGSIQGLIVPPEFLVGVDERYEALSAPGLFASRDQSLRVIDDPPVREFMLSLGANKGLTGLALSPVGASSVATRKPMRHIADFKGAKIRVLASPFQLELIRRMGASPVAMSLGDVLPGLQQGTIDGALATVLIYTTMQYQDAAKYVTETGQPYVTVIAVASKKWVDSLPADLQKIVREDAAKVSQEIVPFETAFFEEQRNVWKNKGGELISLPADEQAALMERIASIGDDMAKGKPELIKAVKLIFESAKRNR
jgi:TRAP-type transport system periplasmic protein